MPVVATILQRCSPGPPAVIVPYILWLIHKHWARRLLLGWVTIWEPRLLYDILFLLLLRRYDAACVLLFTILHQVDMHVCCFCMAHSIMDVGGLQIRLTSAT